jgi:Coenzyme PQQ synthesis protein D (PqqD)
VVADRTFDLAGPDVVAEGFDGDFVVLNLATGQYFGLNEVAGAIWARAVAGWPESEIAEAAKDCCAAAAVRDLLDDLVAHELLCVQPAQRKDVTGSSFDGLSGVPVLEIHDDLADLIVADPIHDVDREAGWPHLPDAA